MRRTPIRQTPYCGAPGPRRGCTGITPGHGANHRGAGRELARALGTIRSPIRSAGRWRAEQDDGVVRRPARATRPAPPLAPVAERVPLLEWRRATTGPTARCAQG